MVDSNDKTLAPGIRHAIKRAKLLADLVDNYPVKMPGILIPDTIAPLFKGYGKALVLSICDRLESEAHFLETQENVPDVPGTLFCSCKETCSGCPMSWETCRGNLSPMTQRMEEA